MKPTPLTLSAPKGGHYWRKRLDPSGFSILPNSASLVAAALAHPNCSADTVAAAMCRDPALCWHFFSHANRKLTATGNEIHSLPHLISLLGFPAAKALLHKLSAAEAPLLYWAQLQNSQLRWQFAKELPLERLGCQPQNIFFATMLSGLPRWLMPHSAAIENEQMLGLARNKDIGVHKAQQIVFGFDVNEYTKKMLKRAPLPNALKQIFNIDRATLRQHCKQHLYDIHHQKKDQSTLANIGTTNLLIFYIDQLIESFTCAPFGRASLRWQHLLASLLSMSTGELAARLHKTAAQLPVMHPELHKLHPARKLLCHWREAAPEVSYEAVTESLLSHEPEPAPAITAQVTSAKSSTESAAADRLLNNRFVDSALVRKNLTALNKGDPALANVNAILNRISQTLFDAIGFSSGALLLPNKSGGWRQHNFTEQGVRSSAVDFTGSALLTKMFTEPGTLLINQHNANRFITHLPQQLAQRLNHQDLLLVSLFFKNRPVAIIWVAEADITPPRQQVCRFLVQGAQQAIARLAIKAKPPNRAQG